MFIITKEAIDNWLGENSRNLRTDGEHCRCVGKALPLWVSASSRDCWPQKEPSSYKAYDFLKWALLKHGNLLMNLLIGFISCDSSMVTDADPFLQCPSQCLRLARSPSNQRAPPAVASKRCVSYRLHSHSLKLRRREVHHAGHRHSHQPTPMETGPHLINTIKKSP